MKQVLIILEDVMSRFVQATGTIQDIKEFHRNDHVTLLTTSNLKYLAEKNPHIDQVVYDRGKPFWHLLYLWQMKKFLGQFERIYDLQHDSRSKLYMKLSNPEIWCSSHTDAGLYVNPQVFKENPMEDALRVQLSMAKIPAKHRPDLSYAAQPALDKLEELNLEPNKFIVLVPGSRRKHLQRRWPHFAKLGALLKAEGYQVAIVGSADEERLVYELSETLDAPLIYNLPLPQLIDIFQYAKAVIGNDTGPFHLASASGTEGIILFGPDPAATRHTPHLTNVQVIQNTDDLSAISPQTVMKNLITSLA
ncbi:MAG: glycosyltransferase family 9 protein [Alphaproteobacteria bacterium]|nr:glycosyltransferase family 9 protein [Alphaproteobacteria bacterium]MDD9920210.1 glycosyltransferase family 9 protein [Alphaproteobacteria bacterium]